MTVKLTDSLAEQELSMISWIRKNTTAMWIGINQDHCVAYVDERLAHRLGYDGVHTSFLGRNMNELLCPTVDKHEIASIQYINDGRPPLPLTRSDPDKFVMMDRAGNKHYCFVKVRVMEDNFCNGFCSIDAKSTTRIFGMAEVTFYADLPKHVQEALAWYGENQGLIKKVDARGGLEDFLKSKPSEEAPDG